MTNDDNKEMKDFESAAADAGMEEASGETMDSSAEAVENPEPQQEEAPENVTESSDETEASAEEAALNELNKKYMRLAADFQNFKRRTEKEKSDIYQYANEKIALDVIEVIDNFERALAHSEECADRQFAEGVEKIYKQLQGVLEKNSIEEIKAEGEPFDPNFHNAVMTRAEEGFESGIVLDAMQKGYTLNGRVIRPSMVVVSQ